MKIRREKPDFQLIRKSGYVAVDMHLHSEYSPDCGTKIKAIVDKAKKKGFGVAITDHNAIGGALEASKTDVFLIPGIEVTSNEGVHILFYFYNIKDLKDFYDKHISKNLFNILRTKLSIKELFDISKKYDCVVSAPHPFSTGCGLYRRKNQGQTEFIEIINGSILKKTNSKAAKLKNIKYTAGTDAHTKSYIGNVVVCAKAKTPQKFLDEVRKGKTFIIGKEISKTKRIMINIVKEIQNWININPKEILKNRSKQVKRK